MNHKILIIGNSDEAQSALYLAKIREEYGNDVELITPEQAKEQGLGMSDFVNIPTFKITAPPIMPVIQYGEYKTGKQRRNERRKNKRKK